MKIIEPGAEYALPWAYKTECGKCRTKVELDLDDIKKGYEGANYGGDTATYCLYWMCPFCGNQPNIPRSMWKVVQHHRPEVKP